MEKQGPPQITRKLSYIQLEDRSCQKRISAVALDQIGNKYSPRGLLKRSLSSIPHRSETKRFRSKLSLLEAVVSDSSSQNSTELIEMLDDEDLQEFIRSKR